MKLAALESLNYRWLFFAAGSLEAATTNRSLGLEVPDKSQRWVGVMTRTPYIAGSSFSAADV
ncbi:MAG: hypothetical protein ACE1ZA_02215 [Pseudomonadales bacterium]